MRNLCKKIFIILAMAAMSFALMGGTMVQPTESAFAAEQMTVEATNSEDYIPSETDELTPIDRPLVHTTDKQQLLDLIQKCNGYKDAAHNMAVSARSLGYDDSNPIIMLAREEWSSAEEQRAYYTEQLNVVLAAEETSKWAAKEKEYPAATTIWRYFKDLGYNDYVCAGIMGNLMAEVGGQTLDIQWWLKGNGYYGMCQWSQGYKSQIWGADLQGQLNFLRDTIKYELDTFGSAYSKGFNYNQFLSLNSAEAAAKAFAKCYERCGSGSYSIRQKNAVVAYNYFVD